VTNQLFNPVNVAVFRDALWDH